MTHESQSTRFEELLQLLSDHGFDGMGEAIEILMNEAMKLERAEVLGAMPYQRTQTGRLQSTRGEDGMTSGGQSRVGAARAPRNLASCPISCELLRSSTVL